MIWKYEYNWLIVSIISLFLLGCSSQKQANSKNTAIDNIKLQSFQSFDGTQYDSESAVVLEIYKNVNFGINTSYPRHISPPIENNTKSLGLIPYNKPYMFNIKAINHYRIKILSSEGIKNEDVIINYKSESSVFPETVPITDIEGISYLKSNGKIITSKVDKKDIKIRQLNDSINQLIFKIPNVEVGSIIEVKYIKFRNAADGIEDESFQQAIPVIKSFYSVSIPFLFKYNIVQLGENPIATKQSIVDQEMSFIGPYTPSQQFVNTPMRTRWSIKSNRYEFLITNLPNVINGSKGESSGLKFVLQEFNPKF